MKPSQPHAADVDAARIPGTYLFDLALSRQGYAFNCMCAGLRKPEARAEFLADPDAYMRARGVSQAHRDAVHRCDWLALTRMGGNLFFFLKLAVTLGVGLYAVGAQMRGESYEEFMRTRNVPGAV